MVGASGKATRWSVTVSLETITDGLMCDMVYAEHLQWPVSMRPFDQVRPYVHMFWSAVCFHSRECDMLATC